MSSPEQEKINKYVAGAPASCRGTLERALAGSGSPRQAIKAKCLSCCNWQRDEIEQCRVILCPLHRWRPFQVGGREGEARRFGFSRPGAQAPAHSKPCRALDLLSGQE